MCLFSLNYSIFIHLFIQSSLNTLYDHVIPTMFTELRILTSNIQK